MRDKLTIYSVMETEPTVIEFTNEAFLQTPQTVREWELVYAGFVLGREPVADDIYLDFQGERYVLNEDGHFVKEEN